MTGTPTGSSVWPAYLLIALAMETGFAFYDVKERRVPDRALACFFLFALLAPLIKLCLYPSAAFSICSAALLGFLFGLIIPLAAAMATGNGTGLGGGDIKLCALLGLLYGSSGAILVLLAASLLALPTSLICRRVAKGRPLSIPFVPFLLCGCFVVTAAQIIL